MFTYMRIGVQILTSMAVALFCLWSPVPTAAAPVYPGQEWDQARQVGHAPKTRAYLDPSIAINGEFPFAVQIVTNRTRPDSAGHPYQCGGSIIHERIVLTAASCLKELSAASITVIAGENYWNGSGTTAQLRQVKEIRNYPHFKASLLENDLALLVLTKPFMYTQSVGPIHLPDKGQQFKGRATVCGWGDLSFKKYNWVLRKTDVPLLAGSECPGYNSTSTAFRFENESMICAGGGKNGEDTCKGDAGGPLICGIGSGDMDPRKYLCGIISRGKGCNNTVDPVPALYTHVSAFRVWIDKQIKEIDPQKSKVVFDADLELKLTPKSTPTPSPDALSSVQEFFTSSSISVANAVWDIFG